MISPATLLATTSAKEHDFLVFFGFGVPNSSSQTSLLTFGERTSGEFSISVESLESSDDTFSNTDGLSSSSPLRCSLNFCAFANFCFCFSPFFVTSIEGTGIFLFCINDSLFSLFCSLSLSLSFSFSWFWFWLFTSSASISVFSFGLCGIILFGKSSGELAFIVLLSLSSANSSSFSRIISADLDNSWDCRVSELWRSLIDDES